VVIHLDGTVEALQPGSLHPENLSSSAEATNELLELADYAAGGLRGPTNSTVDPQRVVLLLALLTPVSDPSASEHIRALYESAVASFDLRQEVSSFLARVRVQTFLQLLSSLPDAPLSWLEEPLSLHTRASPHDGAALEVLARVRAQGKDERRISGPMVAASTGQLIEDLQWTRSGAGSDSWTPSRGSDGSPSAYEVLRQRGLDAVPPLLDALADTRLTRVVRWDPDQGSTLRLADIIRVRDCALSLLREILPIQVPPPREGETLSSSSWQERTRELVERALERHIEAGGR
jgi:hypothetical protein